MKSRKRIVRNWVIAVAALLLLPVFSLQIPYFQNKTAQIVTGYLENKIGTEVRIGRVDLRLFNQLIIKDVYMEDRQGDTLLVAKRMAARFDLLPLLKRQFRFRSVQFYTFSLHLGKSSPEAALNIQYIIDAFRKDPPAEETPIDLHIKNLSLRGGVISYRVGDAEATPGRLNPNHLRWHAIDGKIRLNYYANDSLSLSVQRLKAAEQSGLRIEQLAFDLSVDSAAAVIPQLKLKLPQSELHLSDVSAQSSRSGGNWLSQQVLSAQVDPSHVRLNDLAALVPAFAWFDEPMELQGSISGVWDDLQLDNFLISSGKELALAFDATVRDLDATDWARIYVNGRVRDSHITATGIQQMANNFGPNPLPLPEPLLRLRSISLKGNILGLLNNLTADVQLQAAEIGNLHANVNFGRDKTCFLNGKLSTTGINLHALTAHEDWGSTRFEMHLNTTFTNKKDLAGTANAVVNELDYKGYRYENIGFDGNFTADSFDGELNVDSPDGQLTAKGFVALQDAGSQVSFSAKATNLLLDRLRWTKKYIHPKLSFAVNASFTGNDPDNLTGNLDFHDLRFANSDGDYSLNQLTITSSEQDLQKRLTIQSDLLIGSLIGQFSFSTLAGAVKQTLAAYLPSVVPSAPVIEADSAHFQWDFRINDTQKLSSILQLPLTVYDFARIDGDYHFPNNHLRLDGDFPRLKLRSWLIENGQLTLSNTRNSLELNLNAAHQPRKGNKIHLSANLRAESDSIRSSIQWNDGNGAKNKGKLDFTTQLSLQPLAAAVTLQPSEMIFNDSTWILSPAAIAYQNGRISVNQLKANHNQQSIIIKGAASKDSADHFQASLNAVNLDYIFQSLNLRSLTFGGIATGYVTADALFADNRKVETSLDVQNFSFNNVEFGHLDLAGAWDNEIQGVKMDGNVVRDDTTYVLVDGYIHPEKQEISFNFNAHHGNAAFLRKYLENIARDLTGQISGNIHLFGNWNKPTIEGNIWVDNATFGVDFLNTRYTFSDSVRMTPDSIHINNILLRDQRGNIAHATGAVAHNLLDDFEFLVQLEYDNFLIYNATPKTNPSFYGTAYASGNATIGGTEKDVTINLSLRNNDDTHLTFNFMEQPDIADFDFINFISKNKTPDTPSAAPTSPASGTNVTAILDITANTGAAIDIMMDPATDAKISVTGQSQSLRVEYKTQNSLAISGNYIISDGLYNFNFQQVLTRDFKIKENSSIHFTNGGPTDATLDIQATHTVHANLDDLDQGLMQQADGTATSNSDKIGVNCVLHLTGPLRQPEIKFDLEFPNEKPEIESQIKNYFTTNDMRNRQILYLLLTRRFYTAPEYARSDTRSNNDLSLLISALPSYLLSMLNNASENIRVDTKFRQTYESGGTNTEMELLLSGKFLKNRLIINGNFGYINNPYLNALDNNAPLIGDFDIEYKLTKSGDVRLKGFNRYNYRNYYSLTPEMTQGFGILFRRDFNNLNDLFARLFGKKE